MVDLQYDYRVVQNYCLLMNLRYEHRPARQWLMRHHRYIHHLLQFDVSNPLIDDH